MGKRDPRVDTYIAKSGDFAKPILRHFRELIHAAVPEVSETLKYNAPAFEYKGVLAGMAAFKAHCNLILWRVDRCATLRSSPTCHRTTPSGNG